jgi:hypothetical protein
MFQRLLRRGRPRVASVIRPAAAIWHASTLGILGASLLLQLQRRAACSSAAPSACTIRFNSSHDRLAHNQGPCYRSCIRRSSDGQIIAANSPKSAGSVTYARNTQASPISLSSPTYVYARLAICPPHIYGILAAIALPALAPSQGAQQPHAVLH